jgi:hypothetical protein
MGNPKSFGRFRLADEFITMACAPPLGKGKSETQGAFPLPFFAFGS